MFYKGRFVMRYSLSYILLFSVLFSTNVAWALSDTQNEILYDKVERLEKDVMSLQRKFYTGAGHSSKNTSAIDTSSLDGLYTQITSQQEVIQQLTAKVEQLEYAQKQLEDKLNKMNADIDVRFSMAEKAVAESKNTKAVTSTPVKSNPKEMQAAYDKAYAAMKKGDYKTAEAGFTSFMKKYPKSDLIGNANYWLGETYYARGQFEQAVGIFADGFTKYKKNSKAPDNLLKLGLSMNKLGRKQDACTAFTSLSSEFPKASQTVKNRAKAEAKKLSCK